MNEPTTSRGILLVEDNDDDVVLMRRALKAAGISNPLFVVEDGEAAIDYLAGNGKYTDRATFPIPALMFLDLKLPLKSGHEVLEWVRSQPLFASLVIVVLTSSNEPYDLKTAYGLGANSYVVKPPTAGQLNELARAFKWYWLEFNSFEHNPVA
ncbi:MAG: response regulator [Verrucomicrobiota bacterium]|nr:response regulator [Verrucomicrobiota bacterium]